MDLGDKPTDRKFEIEESATREDMKKEASSILSNKSARE